jgi:uncharacterized membrane protein YeaQ/YmgE (transglycosylase-associated protein family)
MMEAVDRKQPAIIGGVIVGLLSSIPLISLGNVCCCLWAIVGGVVAAKLLIDRSPQPVKSADGAMIGLMAGAIGGAIYLIISVPLNALMSNLTLGVMESLSHNMGDLQFQKMMQQVIERQREQPLAMRLVLGFLGAIVGGVILTGFTTLGGLLGVAFFEKRKGDQMPPPPPSYPPQYPPAAPPPPSRPPSSGDEGGGAGGGSV